MALKGLDIFKLSPKKNCKECGSPTCMAFCMKVAQGAVSLDKCPYFSEEALAGKNVLFMSAKNENYKTVGASVALANGQKLGAETADDINLAKQLNIMLKGLNVNPENVVMDIGTAAVGYGYEYAASTFDRSRLAALGQSDADLQMPILAAVCNDTWGVKESTASVEDEPAWGCQEERAISMEVATAAADLTGGADAVVLRHPESVATIKKFITELI